jgi:hypothetical protein
MPGLSRHNVCDGEHIICLQYVCNRLTYWLLVKVNSHRPGSMVNRKMGLSGMSVSPKEIEKTGYLYVSDFLDFITRWWVIA